MEGVLFLDLWHVTWHIPSAMSPAGWRCLWDINEALTPGYDVTKTIMPLTALS